MLGRTLERELSMMLTFARQSRNCLLSQRHVDRDVHKTTPRVEVSDKDTVPACDPARYTHTHTHTHTHHTHTTHTHTHVYYVHTSPYSPTVNQKTAYK